MKLFRVLVTWTDSVDIVIEADDIDEAKKQAVELVENGRTEHVDSSEADNFQASDIGEIKTADSSDKLYARLNKKAYQELTEENND